MSLPELSPKQLKTAHVGCLIGVAGIAFWCLVGCWLLVGSSPWENRTQFALGCVFAAAFRQALVLATHRAAYVTCGGCGKGVPAVDEFCSFCGHRLPDDGPAAPAGA